MVRPARQTGADDLLAEEAVGADAVEDHAGAAHHVDISGEPQFLESMQLKYGEEAESKGLYIIGSCGFDSIPSDVGQVRIGGKETVDSTFTYCA